MIAQMPADRRNTGGDGDAMPVEMSGGVQEIARSIVAINRDETVLMAELKKRRGSRHLAQIKPQQCCHTSLSQEQPDRSSRGRFCSAMRRRKAAFVADMRSRFRLLNRIAGRTIHYLHCDSALGDARRGIYREAATTRVAARSCPSFGTA